MAVTKQRAIAALNKIGATLDPELLNKGVYWIETPKHKVFKYNDSHDYMAGQIRPGGRSKSQIWSNILFVAQSGLTDCTSQYCDWCPTEKEGN